MDVDLYQRRAANRLEAVNLARFDHEDVSGAALEGLVANGPDSPALTYELNFVIRMPVRAGSRAGLPVEQENRNSGITLLSSHKLMGTTNKGQILLAHVKHTWRSSGKNLWTRRKRVAIKKN